MIERTYSTTYLHPWHEEFCRRTAYFDSAAPWPAFSGIVRRRAPSILHGAGGIPSGWADLLAAGLLARAGRTVILADATWDQGSRAIDRRLRVPPSVGFDAPPRFGRGVSRAMIRSLDARHLHYAVLSTHELRTFPQTWGVAPERVHFTPFCATVEDLDPVPPGSGVIVSGTSMRDYRPLLQAAPAIRAEITLATELALPSSLPRNVAAGFFDQAEHDRRFRDAAVVVVALMTDTVRSGGQQTYLNAMVRGMPVVVTDAPGVRDYVQDGVTGLVVPNAPQAIAEAVNRLLEDRELSERLGRAARADVLERFTARAYVDRLLGLADELADGV